VKRRTCCKSFIINTSECYTIIYFVTHRTRARQKKGGRGADSRGVGKARTGLIFAKFFYAQTQFGRQRGASESLATGFNVAETAFSEADQGCGSEVGEDPWREESEVKAMRTLATVVRYQGRALRQLKRVGSVAIYDVRNAGNMLYGYEVIIIKVAPREEVFGKEYPERELYPSSTKNSEDWGTLAWSYGIRQKLKAIAAFNGLVKAEVQGEGVFKVNDLGLSEGKDSGEGVSAS
jgi:hypothetical protein